MNEDYVSYELAVKLQAAGFDEPCIAQWACEPDGKPILVGSTAFVFSNPQLKGRDVTAPLLFHAQKWLREKKGIDICVCRSFSVNNGYHYELMKDRNFEDMTAQSICAGRSYEQSLSDAIAAALELIKKGE